MNILLDTHTLLWLLNGDENISEKIKTVLANPQNIKYVSVVSFWEIAIKVSVKKLEIDFDLENLAALILHSGFILLSINEKHALAVSKLPFLHKDPFDRLLIAQAQIENFTIITKDRSITKYNVQAAWG